MAEYDNSLPPGFKRPVTLKNLVEVLENLRKLANSSEEELQSIQQAIESLKNALGAALSHDLPITLSGVTLDDYGPDFFLNEKIELTAKLLQQQQWAASRQKEARFQQKIRTELSKIGVTL